MDGIDAALVDLSAAKPVIVATYASRFSPALHRQLEAAIRLDNPRAADLTALDCARLNIADPRAEFHWADALSFAPASPADHVVTNPPFHRGREGDPDIGRGFITAAASMLGPRGQLWLVANRHLPYESTLQDAFQSVEILGQTASFKLYTAARPRSSRKG